MSSELEDGGNEAALALAAAAASSEAAAETSAAEDVGTARSDCGDIWIDGDFLLGVTAAAGLAMAFVLNQAITMAGRRRRRRRKKRDAPGSVGGNLWQIFPVGRRMEQTHTTKSTQCT